MIAVVNVSTHEDDWLGVHDYEVRLNRQVIAAFKHRRSDGLAACLAEAARAVERAQWEEVYRVLGRIEGLSDTDGDGDDAR